MRVLLDTNVLIAAFISHGSCHELFEHCVRQHSLVTSEFILNEFREKLRFKFRYEEKLVQQSSDLLESCSELIVLPPVIPKICRDLDDDPVLATSVSGQCQCIVTGDQDLLILKKHGEISIVSPTDFWAYEAGLIGEQR
ncbi:MAG: putative toxin-antitoxin system toxin component, PIN family [Leptospirales bacterium]